MVLLRSVLLLLFATASWAARDASLCPADTTTGFLPDLPDQWLVQFKYSRWTGKEAQSHQEGYEAFDAVRKRSGHVYANDGDFMRMYQHVADFRDQKSYRIHFFVDYYEKDACVPVDLFHTHIPSDLINDPMKNGQSPVGPMLVMQITGTALSPGVIRAEQTASDEKFRDMLPVKYTGCYYNRARDETYKFNWFYINKPGTKTMIPLGAKVTIKRPDSPDYQYLRYDFVSFTFDQRAFYDLVEDTNIFEIPVMYSCNMNAPVSFPDVSDLNVQTYSIEYVTLDPVYSWLKQQLEKYNYHRKYYEEKDNLKGQDGKLYPLLRMGDYSTGVRYNIDRYLGACSVTPLNIGLDSAAVVHDDGLCIKSPNETFGAQRTFTYDGIKTLRGMECNTFTTDSMAADGRLSRRIQWCFATNETISGSHPTMTTTPILLALGYNNSENFAMLYQEMFSFQNTNPPLYAFDVSECYRSMNDSAFKMRHFVIQFPLSISNAVNTDPTLFKTSFIRTVRHTSGLTEIRIVNVMPEVSTSSVDVTFSLLPPAPIEGALSPTKCPPIYQPSIDEAASKLTAAVKAGTFTVELRRPFSMPEDPAVATVTAFASETAIYESPRRTPQAWFTGISSAVMTVCGVLMAILGFAAGVALYLYFLGPYLAKRSLIN